MLIVIRPLEQDDTDETGLGAYFSDRLHASWAGGLRMLADTVTVGLRVIVGGLVWWLLLRSSSSPFGTGSPDGTARPS